MSKAEEFIKAKTRIGSNTTNGWRRKGVFIPSYSLPWLTPDDARRAVEIAREEMIDKFYDWLKSNATYIHPRKGTEECITTLVKLKEAMRDE